MFATSVRAKHRILDFDIENRPLAYWYDGMTTGEVTAIAWAWATDRRPKVEVHLLDPDPASGPAMLEAFVEVYEEADMVTGHFIRAHDLPILNGAMLEHKLPPLEEKMTSDTKLDLIKRKDLSASQESLAAMYGLPQPKHHMSQEEWREGNRLTPRGMEATRTRVVSDVKQHMALRARLLEADALGTPKVWRP
jgi:hypothetical protein